MATVRRTIVQLLTLLGLYSLLRVLFYYVNQQLFLKVPFGDIVKAWLNGMRYDLAAIALINTVIAILSLISLKRLSPKFERGKALVLGLAFTLVNGFALSLNIIDLEYFKFTGKRLTADSFLLARDIGDQTAQIAWYYWYYSILMLAVYAILGWVSLRNYRKDSKSHWAWIIIFTLAGALAMRGGWQAKPLIPANAFSQNPEVGALVLNSTFTILKSSDKAAVTELNEMPWTKVKEIIQQSSDTSAEPLSADWPTPKNIVVIILESFGAEYVFAPEGKPAYAPFLKELSERGSHFSNAFANARRSIDALPAVFAGIPTWMEPPFITSPYQTNRITPAPLYFAGQGYETPFFHGGNNGTMFFDVMTKRLGFDEYFGSNEYPDRADYDGKWGIFDEPYLQYMAKNLDARTKPFFATVFTLSSHHPYTIPPQHQGKFPKGTLEIHESVGYADFALRRFYETAKTMPWFSDTLFVITADHTSKQEYAENDNIPGRFHVPLVMIYKDKALPFSPEVLRQPVQHADISATLLDLARFQMPESSHFGESLCRLSRRPGVIVYDFDGYHLIGKNRGLSWWRDDRTANFSVLSPLGGNEKAESDQELIQYLKASAHYYNNGMVRNQLVW
ncbi:MAG: LTA synthase family protein [Bdellovibrionota bacterium]